MCHDALDLDAVASKEAQDVEAKAQAGGALFVGKNVGVGDARVIVDRQMQIFPADPRVFLRLVRSPVMR